MVYAFMGSFTPGEITRRVHVEEWREYVETQGAGCDDAASMHAMFGRMRVEIALLDDRSRALKCLLVDLADLVRLVQEMPSAPVSTSRRGPIRARSTACFLFQ